MLCGFLFHSLELGRFCFFFLECILVVSRVGGWLWNETERNWICCMCCMHGSGHITEYRCVTFVQCFPLRYIPILCSTHTHTHTYRVAWCLYFFFSSYLFIFRRPGSFFVCTSTNSNMVFVEHEFSSVTHTKHQWFFFFAFFLDFILQITSQISIGGREEKEPVFLA